MNPPYRVFAKSRLSRTPQWFIWVEVLSHFIYADRGKGDWIVSAVLNPVEHPRNDPEALAIIEQAKKTRIKL